ncbi:MAG TPA: glycosyltransferase family 4 protein [Streptosporangiaceae bacterium]|nr:glycosyltransferase family 4 protein [Streptosporangiaceae bacterium]
MKVAFVLGTSTGGIARHVKMLADGCAARGVQAAVFGPARTGRDIGLSGAHVTFAPAEIGDRTRVLGDLRTIARLRRLLAAWRPDVVHAHGLRAGALTAVATSLVRPAGYAARPALVVTVHNAPPAGVLAAATYRVLELTAARGAVSVLCVSPDLEDRMRAAGARRVGRAVVAAPAAPPVGASGPAAPPVGASARAAPPAPAVGAAAQTSRASRRPVVLAAGRLAPQKGFGTLLEAAARWRDIRPEPVLVIAGAGPLEADLRRKAASLGLAVQFAGHRRDVQALLDMADVFVLPSRWEGQPLVLQEALRAGAAIVATRVGGVAALTGERAALLVPPGDPERLAAAVRSVLTDPVLAATLREAAAGRARSLPGEDDAVAAALAEYAACRR